MTLSLFAGEVEGKPIVGAHSLILGEQLEAARLLDRLTPWTFPMPDEYGWSNAPVAPEFSPEDVIAWLSRAVPDVEWRGNIPREQVIACIGEEATATLIDRDAGPDAA